MKKRIAGWIALLMTLICVSALADGSDNWLAGVLGGARGGKQATDHYVALLQIDGELSESDYIYDHVGTLDALDALAEDECNDALLLYLNTPGGNMYESDELYHELMMYREKTGRPIYGYMAQECCSGGMLVAMAADELYASRMTIAGNIGVYMTAVSDAELYKKVGVELEYIATGENKVPGYPELTDEQREIYRAMVEESFDFFKEAIASARGLSEEQMASFTDGRLLTAIQAKELGLIDDVMYYDELVDALSEKYPDDELKNVTPDGYAGYAVSSGSSPSLDWLSEIEKLIEENQDTTGGRHVLRGR